MKNFTSLIALTLSFNVLLAGTSTYSVTNTDTSGTGSLELGISNLSTSIDAVNEISIDLSSGSYTQLLIAPITVTPSSTVSSVNISASSGAVLTLNGSSGYYPVTFLDAGYPIAFTTDTSLPITNADVHFNLSNGSALSSMNFGSSLGDTGHYTTIFIDDTNTSPITLTGNITGNRGIWNKSAHGGSILTLSGTNTATGTNITLDPGSTTVWNNTSPPLEAITNAGTLTCPYSFNATATSAISNSGTLKLSGGIFIGGITGGSIEFLSGTTTFKTTLVTATHYTIDNGATLDWSFGSAQPPADSTIVNLQGGAIVFTASGLGTYAGTIQNAGSLTLHSGIYSGSITDGLQVGSVIMAPSSGHSVFITGAAVYTGTTTVTSGYFDWNSASMPQGNFVIDTPAIFQFDNTGDVGLEGTYTGDITNNGALHINANIIYAGTISGTTASAQIQIENPSLTVAFSGDTSAFSGNYSTNWSSPVSTFIFSNGNVPGNSLSQITMNAYGVVQFDQPLTSSYEGSILFNDTPTFLTLAGGTFSGTVSSSALGDGSLTLASGITTLTHADLFTGTLSISPGASLIWANTNPPAVGIESGGSLTFNTAFGSYSSDISGSGTILLSGAGNTYSGTISGSNAVRVSANTIFTGSYTYTGGTDITAGTLTLESGITLPSTGDLTIDAGAALVSADAYTINGKMVNNGSLTAPSITVASDAEMGGSGSFDGAVICNGTLSPSGSFTISGSLTLAGDIVLEGSKAFSVTQGSILNLHFSSLGADEVIISNNVTINPGASVHLIEAENPGVYSALSSFVILESLGGGTITGEFLPISQNLGDHLSASLSYLPTEVILNIERDSLTAAVTDGNAIEIAGVIDTLYNTFGNQVDSVFANLLGLSNAELEIAIAEIDPSSFKAISIIQQQNAVAIETALSYRLQPLLDSEHCQTICAGSCTKELEKKPFQVWFNVLGDILSQNEVIAAATFGPYRSNSIGYVLGLDYNFAKYFYVGALGAFSDSHLKWEGTSNYADIDSYYGGLYFSAIGKMFYVNISEIASSNVYDTHKRIVYTGMDTTAKSHHTGAQLVSHLDTGINFGLKGFSIRPFDAFDYIVQNENGYTETGAGALDLTINSMNAIMIRNELGLYFAKCLNFRTSRWIFDIKTSWIRETRLKGKSYVAQFAGTGIEFETEGFYPNRSLFSPGVSITGFMVNDRLSLALYYQGAFRQGYSDNDFGGRISFNF